MHRLIQGLEDAERFARDFGNFVLAGRLRLLIDQHDINEDRTEGDVRVMMIPRWVDGMGNQLAGVHDESKCLQGNCCIHNPSDHHMREWPTNFREGFGMERMCPHGIGHPDPDDPMISTIHSCDGCCHTPEDDDDGTQDTAED